MSHQPDPNSSGKTTRRQFARNLALLAATPLLARDGVVRAADEQPPDPLTATAAALADAARARFGQNLAEDHVNHVRESIRRSLLSGQFLRRSKLQNGDEPAFVFRAALP